ncbi:MAG: ABC transporter substrate-binding protein [Solibacillus sp.]
MKKLLTIIILVCSTFLAACSGGDVDQASSSGNQTLIIGIESEADVLDPHRAGGWVTFRINRQMHESLVVEDLSLEGKSKQTPDIIPALAKSWEISPDGLVYTFKLQEGVNFHDGTPFNAEAADFNFRRVYDENFEFFDQRSASALVNTISKIESTKVIDEYTFEVHFTEPFSAFLRLMAGERGITMISPEALKKAGNDLYAENPVGTGPFKFSQRVRGEKIELTRNEDYWGTKPILEKVIFQPIPNQAARTLALESGQVDVIAVPAPDSVANLESKGFVVDSGAPPHVWYLNMNMNNKIIQDKKVRQAIAMAIDRKGMAETLLKGTATAAYSIQSPANEAYDPNFVDYEYNPEKAKQLLAEAGYPNGFDTVFQTSVDGSGQLIPVPMAEWIQQDLAEVGINVKLETYEWISYIGMWTNMSEEIGFNQMSWGMTSPFHLYNIVHSASGANASNYSNDEVDSLINSALTATDPAQAVEHWKQAHQIIADDAAIIPIVNDTAPYAMASYVKGFVVPNQEWFDLTPVSIEQ